MGFKSINYVASMGFATLKAKLLRKPQILTAQIMLNYTCNAHCQYCSAPHSRDVMAFEKVQEILEILKRHGTLQVSYAGGEPTIHPQYESIMALSREMGYFITVSSNGLDPRPILSSPKNKRPHVVSISLDGPAELHDIYRGYGSWKKAWSTLEELKKYNIARTINAVIGKNNCRIENLQWLLKTAIGLKASVGFQFMLPRYDAEDKENPLAANHAQRQMLLKSLLSLSSWEKQRLIFDDSILKQLLTWEESFPYYRNVVNKICYAGRYFIFIRPDGIAAPCSLLEEHPWYKENYITGENFEEALKRVQRIPCNDCYLGCNLLRNKLLSLRGSAVKRIWSFFT